MPAQFPEATVHEPATPAPQVPAASPPGIRWNSSEEVVVSGLAGRFPECSNAQEFREQLFAGVDLITEDDRRWPVGLHGLPTRSGKLKDINRFDASFFGVHPKQAETMDPQIRMMLELTYEAIVDAGLNPEQLRGSRTGVFVGMSGSESYNYWCSTPDKVNGYGLSGCGGAMFSNRISYTFDFKGPSFALDTACSSSMLALHQAVVAMRSGQCDSAVVGGVSLALSANSALQFHRLNLLAADGKCKSFDASGDGYVRSEAAVILLLQKKSESKRVYATIVNTGANVDGFKEQGITFPAGAMQKRLVQEVLQEAGVDPAEVSYVEAHGTGTKVGDPQELNAIAELFCKDRTTPLLIGSVKSNMGHSEPASGLCSVAKVLVAMETGIIPPNLHYKQPNPDIPALHDGRLQVVTEPLPWKGGLACINSFGFGGANGHVLLRSFTKPKFPAPRDVFPRLVSVSATTQEGVEAFLDKLESMPRDDELLGLIHEVHSRNIAGHHYRGYTILESSPSIREVTETSIGKRPVWFVFSGMGSQWAGMGKDLMGIKVFEKSIRRSAQILKPLGVDLLDILANGNDNTFSNILNAFVGIVSVQVALVDTLASLGIHPDGMVGHSVGELGCAYADGTLTAEQTVLAAYWRGRVICEAQLSPGAMAAIGLSWEAARARCPEEICLACDNSADNVTVSGPVEAVRQLVGQLQEEGVFAKEVDSSGVAFHSRYISELAPVLRRHLEQVVPSPKMRTSRWVSSSVPEQAWHTPLAQMSSAAYHVNNVLSPVLFREALAHVPEEAVVVEVAPHCLLQAVLRRALPSSCLPVGLTKRLHPDNLSFFLAALGRLYNAGLQPKLARLYHKVKYPVGRGTPMIAPLVQWDHSAEWAVAGDSNKGGGRSGEFVVEVDLNKDEDKYLLGHEIDGRLIYPATGYMTLVWKTLAALRGQRLEDLPVVLEDVHFHRATMLPRDGAVKFLVNVFGGSGEFEVCEAGSVAATGRIRPLDTSDTTLDGLPDYPSDDDVRMTSKEVYRALRLRGYDYSGVFKGIDTADIQGESGELLWKNNWVSFMDTVLQFSIVGDGSRGLYLPARLQRVVVDPRPHVQLADDTVVKVRAHKNVGIIKAGGVEMRGLTANLAPRRQNSQAPPKLEKYVFVPYITAPGHQATMDGAGLELERAVTACMQVVLENFGGVTRLKVAELAGSRTPESLLSPLVVSILHGEPMVDVDVTIAGSPGEQYSSSEQLTSLGARIVDEQSVGKDQHLIVACYNKQLDNIADYLRPGGFLLLVQSPPDSIEEILSQSKMQLVSVQRAPNNIYVLLRKVEEVEGEVRPLVVAVREDDVGWLEPLKSALKHGSEHKTPVILLSQGQRTPGLLGLTTCLSREYDVIRCVFVRDEKAPEFSLEHPVYAQQLKKDLRMNVYQDGQWGSYRHIRIEDNSGKSTLQVQHAYVNALTRGDLTSLKWIEGPLSYYQPELHPGSELCHVYYAPLNFRDVMLATGKLPPDALPGDLAGQDCILGTEFSGRDSTGRRVMGLVPARGMATTVLALRRMLWNVPDQWSLEEASTVPVVYCTAYYALVVRGRMRPGESLLVHAGSGGVGLASIAIALHMGVTVFTTVGSQEKRDFLKSRFPQLTDRNFANSRDTTFEQHVLGETGGRGVDLVLNSLAEDKLQASLRCLARHGRFLEIGKFDLSKDNLLGMSMFLKNTSFHGILLDALFDSNTGDDEEVVRLLDEGIKSGAVRPLPATVFAEQQAEQAFRYLASGKHIGKVVLKIREEESERVSTPTSKMVAAVARVYLDPEKVYVLVGGLGGFGLELADWLVQRGATRLVLTSRSGLKTGYQARCVLRWRKAGVQVVVSTADCATNEGAQELLKTAAQLGPVGGVFNLAAVLKDALLDDLGEEDFTASRRPKADATRNLDQASRRLCPQLDYFVVFSSVVSGRGNMGQANYGEANSAAERVCEVRQSDGLPGLAVQWGAVGDVGMVADLLGDKEAVIGGTLPQRMSSCLASLDVLLHQPHPVVASMVLAEKKKADDGASKVGLLDAVAKIMGIKDVKKLNPKVSLAEMGMDSLMGAEIKQTLERNYDIVLTPQDIRTLTFGSLIERSVGSPGARSTNASTSPVDNDTGKMESLPELIPAQVLVRLPSRATDDSVQTPLFVVHAVDGSVDHLRSVAAELSVPVWGLQCTALTPVTSVQDMAAFYLQHMREVQSQGPYTVCGYSYGAMVAYEICLQLEESGEQTSLVLLDGSPAYITHHALTFTNIHERGSAAKEAQIVANIVNLYTDIDYHQMKEEMEALSSWDERLARCVDVLSKVSPYSTEQLTAVAEALNIRMVIGDNYDPSHQYRGDVVLCRASDNFMQLEDDYGLSKICEQTPRVHVVDGNHKQILRGDNAKRIADIIRSLTRA